MAQWRKVVVSGSNAVLNQISASGNIVPTSDNGADLGSSGLEWKDLYIDGTAYLDSATITAGTISGITDLAIADGGTGQSNLNNLITLTTHTTGNYVATVTGGTGIDSDGATSGEGIAHSLTLDLNELGTETAIAQADFVAMVDADDDGSQKITFSNFEDEIFGNVSGDATVAAGGALTIAATSVEGSMLNDNVISGQGALGGASVAQADLLLIDDGPGTIKSVTFSNFEDSIFGNVSGDIAIAAGGAATVTGATTNAALTAGAGISAGGTFDGATARTFALDLNELTEEVIATGDHIAFNDAGDNGQHKDTIDDIFKIGPALVTEAAVAQGTDYILFLDGGSTGETKKESIPDFVDAINSTGIDASSGLLSVAAAQTSITSIINSSFTKIGTAAAQEYITFGTSDEVNTFVDNTERLSVTATGVDITGVATVSSNLTVGGNLDVNGTLTTIDTANSYVADKFMIFASGSTSATDGGFIVQNDVNSGYALGYDTGTSRWVLDNNLAHNATNIVPDAYVGTVELGTTHGDSQSAPTYGSGVGSIYVDTDDNEIWIYA